MDTAPLDLPIFPDTEPSPVELNLLLQRIKRGVNAQVFRAFGHRVLNGPFVGMSIPERNASWDDGNSGTKLLGTYEHELHDAIRFALWRSPHSIINVGCGDGYYAIGLARMLIDAKVFAFDIDPMSLAICSEYAARNDVADRVMVRGGCKSPLELHVPEAAGHRLYVVDCEGAEIDLVDLAMCPELRHSDLIIECHDFLKAGASVQLADRLARTHRVELIHPTLPDLGHFQFVKHSPSVMSVLAAVEKRPLPSCWLACWTTEKGN